MAPSRPGKGWLLKVTLVALGALSVLLGEGGVRLGARTDPASWTCFPTCANDGRMLTVAENFSTLSGQELELLIHVAPGTTNFKIEVFDADRTGFWDVAAASKLSPDLRFRLYNDPNANGTGKTAPAVPLLDVSTATTT